MFLDLFLLDVHLAFLDSVLNSLLSSDITVESIRADAKLSCKFPFVLCLPLCILLYSVSNCLVHFVVVLTVVFCPYGVSVLDFTFVTFRSFRDPFVFWFNLTIMPNLYSSVTW